MPDTLKKLDIAKLTDQGRVRKVNEDYVDFKVPDPNSEEGRFGSLFIVADGIGSLGKGEVASREATEAFIKEYYNTDVADNDIFDRIRNGVDAANDKVIGWAQHFELEKMGTTLAGMVIMDSGEAYVFNVGDSRVYRLRNNTIKQMSQDTSVSGGGKNAPLTRYIGQATSPEPVMVYVESIDPGDTYLICSDGLDKTVSEDEMLKVTRTRRAQAAVKKLVAMANDRGAPDNVTALVLRNGSPAFNPIPILIGLGVLALVAAVVVLLVMSNQQEADAEATSVALQGETATSEVVATTTQQAADAILAETQVAVEANETATAIAVENARATEIIIEQTAEAMAQATDNAQATERAAIPTNIEATNAAVANLTAISIAQATTDARSTANAETAIANTTATAHAQETLAAQTQQAQATATAEQEIAETQQAQATADAQFTATRQAANVNESATAQAQSTLDAQSTQLAFQAALDTQRTATEAVNATATAMFEMTVTANALATLAESTRRVEATATAQQEAIESTATAQAFATATVEAITATAEAITATAEAVTATAEADAATTEADAATAQAAQEDVETATNTPVATETVATSIPTETEMTVTPTEAETEESATPATTETPEATAEAILVPANTSAQETYDLQQIVDYAVAQGLVPEDESAEFANNFQLATDGGLQISNRTLVLQPVAAGSTVFSNLYLRSDSIVTINFDNDVATIITVEEQDYIYASCALTQGSEAFNCFVPFDAVVQNEVVPPLLIAESITAFLVEPGNADNLIRYIPIGAEIEPLGKADIDGETWYYVLYIVNRVERRGWIIGSDVAVNNDSLIPVVDPENPPQP